VGPFRSGHDGRTHSSQCKAGGDGATVVPWSGRVVQSRRSGIVCAPPNLGPSIGLEGRFPSQSRSKERTFSDSCHGG